MILENSWPCRIAVASFALITIIISSFSVPGYAFHKMYSNYGSIKQMPHKSLLIQDQVAFRHKHSNVAMDLWMRQYSLPGIQNAQALPYANGTSTGLVNTGQASSNQSGLLVGTYPVGIAVNPVNNKIYVTNEFSNSVSVISGTLNTVANTIPVGNFPYAVAINPFNSRVYVTNRGSDTVSVIDGSTNTKLDNVTVQKSPVGIAVDPSANWIYVTNIDSNAVSVIDGITNKIITNINTGKVPYGIALNPITKKVYVSNMLSNTVSVIDEIANKIIANLTVGENPVGIAINPSTNKIYVTNYSSSSVSVIDGATDKVVDTISVGRNPVGIAVNPTTNKVYATNVQSHSISVINSNKNKVTTTIIVNPSLSGSYRVHDPILSMPLAAKFPLIASLVAVNDVSNVIYVTNTGSDTVSIVDGKVDGIVERTNFNINPPNSGDIQCNGQQILQSTFVFYKNGTRLHCQADSGQGYEFNSWSNMVNGSSNPLDLRVSEYGGTLTANYKPTLTFEQYLAVIIGPISIASIVIGWFFRNRQRRHLNKYMAIIETAYETLSDNNNTKDCLLHLQLIRKEITNLFGRGKISDGYYNILDRKISEYVERVKNDKS